jgi:mRNA interferase MazF
MNDLEGQLDLWHPLKKNLAIREKLPFSAERQVWWCSIGFNLGGEAYGKGASFTRPVLILKKLNFATFIGIPMSSKLKVRSDYHIIDFKGKQNALMLGEIRKFDSRRLMDKMGRLSEDKFRQVWEALAQYIQPGSI